MAQTFLELLTAAVSGGVGAKALDWLIDEWKRRSGEGRSARQVVERHLDPILKSADELVGKIRSLAASDFSDIPPRGSRGDPEIESLSLVYLFAQFWSWLQILRREGVYVVLNSVREGMRLQQFMRALEGRRVRLVSRALQRGIGEALIQDGDSPRVMSLYEFVKRCAMKEGDQRDDLIRVESAGNTFRRRNC